MNPRLNPRGAPCRKLAVQLFKAALPGALLLLVAGCQTGKTDFPRVINEHQPLAAAKRANFGTVGLLPTQHAVEISFRVPANRADMVNRRTGEAFEVMRSMREDDDASFQEWLGEFAFDTTVALTVGLVRGLVEGVPEANLTRAEAALRRAWQEEPLEQSIHVQIQQQAPDLSSGALVTLPPTAESLVASNGTATADYRALAGFGIDSVLTVQVARQHFHPADGLNPPITLESKVDFVLIRVADGARLHESSVVYRGNERRFTEWGASNARAFRKEMDRASKILSSAILRELFGGEDSN